MHSPSLHWIKLQNFLKKQFLKFEEKKVWKKNCRISQLLRVYILFGYQIRFFTLVFYIGTNHLCVDFERHFIQNSLNKLLFTLLHYWFVNCDIFLSLDLLLILNKSQKVLKDNFMIRNIHDNNYYNMYLIIFSCLWIQVFNSHILVYDLLNNDAKLNIYNEFYSQIF